jgi:hypothetical protein
MSGLIPGIISSYEYRLRIITTLHLTTYEQANTTG